MKKNLNRIGMLILVFIFVLFYLVASFFLKKQNINKEPITPSEQVVEDNNHINEKNIVTNLYNNAKILYDVVNNKYVVDQNDQIIIGNIIYKKITNFDEVTNNIFTNNGIKKYIDTLGNYFAYTEDGYYLAGNLVSYQTYYFRGDETNIYITHVKEKEIEAIIYERWTASNKNTLATIKVVNNDNKWLIDDIDILATE